MVDPRTKSHTTPPGTAATRGWAGRLMIAAVFGAAAGLAFYVGLRYFLGIELLGALGYGNF